MFSEIGDGALNCVGTLFGDEFVKSRPQARAIGQHDLYLLAPVADRFAPAAPRIAGRGKLQFEQMPDDPVNLAVQLMALRPAQALDLLRQILPVEREIGER